MRTYRVTDDLVIVPEHIAAVHVIETMVRPERYSDEWRNGWEVRCILLFGNDVAAGTFPFSYDATAEVRDRERAKADALAERIAMVIGQPMDPDMEGVVYVNGKRLSIRESCLSHWRSPTGHLMRCALPVEHDADGSAFHDYRMVT